MTIPIQGDSLRIRDGKRVLAETCFESTSDGKGPARGRTLSVFTKWPYQLGKKYWLLGSGEEECAVLVHSVQIRRGGNFQRVTFSLTWPADN